MESSGKANPRNRSRNDRWIQVKFDEIEKRLEQAFSLRDKAIDASKEELRERLAKMNEIREQLDRQAATFADRGRVESKFEAASHRLSAVEKGLAAIETKAFEMERIGDRRLLVIGLAVAVMQIVTIVVIRLVE